ncbi:hypothetical protein [Nocardia lasii]|uniref:Alpha/beta hydrolase n=1 Tax=Nocardia lasii TaxID=1616107 RepID=A0ABW1JMX7_9NOCA
MATPVFVIHGIGNRDEPGFATSVETLGRATGVANPRPVYWGDLGARYEWVEHTVPGAQVAVLDASAAEDGIQPEFLLSDADVDLIRTQWDQVPEVFLDAVEEALAREWGSEEVRGAAVDIVALRAALAEAWPDTTWLKMTDDEQVLRTAGEAVAGSILPGMGGAAGEVEILGFDLVGFLRNRFRDVDRVVGAVVGGAAGRLNRSLRQSFLPEITKGVGDILVYQRHRDEIAQHVRDVIAKVDPRLGRSAEHPVDIVAHSLGGVIMVDLATSDEPLWIRRLITFGSQSPFFHVCDPRGGAIVPYAGERPVELPPTIRAWSNLWEPLDPVAFVAAHVFRLHDGSKPKDIKVPHLASTGLWTHTRYWKHPSVVEHIAETLGS